MAFGIQITVNLLIQWTSHGQFNYYGFAFCIAIGAVLFVLLQCLDFYSRRRMATLYLILDQAQLDLQQVIREIEEGIK